MSPGNGETIIEYSYRIMELVTELVCIGHATFNVDQKPALLRRLRTVIDVIAGTIMTSQYEFHEVVTKLIVRKSCIKQIVDKTEAARTVRSEKSERETFHM